jgi:hypothetical protein
MGPGSYAVGTLLLLRFSSSRECRPEEVKEMIKYYFRIGRYFLSTMVLTGFGWQLGN